jgi:hypothetical protein
MFFALVHTVQYAKWCFQKERSGILYIYNDFMKEYLSTQGTSALRWNVPPNEQAGFLTIYDKSSWWEYSWIRVKPGWSVKYNLSKA